MTLLADLLHLFKHIIVDNALVGIGENRLLFNEIIPLLLIPDRIGVSLEVHRAACVLPAFQNRHNGTAEVLPDAGRICNTASEAASAAILSSYIEILTVPMALRVIRIAETLSASAETRGIDLKRRKSNYLSLRFSAWDAVFCVLLAASVSAGLIIQQSPYQLN